MRIRWIPVFGGALVLVLGAVYAIAKTSQTERLELVPNAASPTLPPNSAWTWTFPMPAEFKAGSYLGVEIRLKSQTVGAQPEGMRMGSFPISHSQADRTFGTGGINASFGTEAHHPSRGAISIALLDLSEIGAQSDRPGTTLRLLSKLTVGGGSVRLSSDCIYLEGKSFGGWSFYDDGRWQNEELPIMKFMVQAEQRQDNYDVVLVIKPSNPSK